MIKSIHIECFFVCLLIWFCVKLSTMNTNILNIGTWFQFIPSWQNIIALVLVVLALVMTFSSRAIAKKLVKRKSDEGAFRVSDEEMDCNEQGFDEEKYRQMIVKRKKWDYSQTISLRLKLIGLVMVVVALLIIYVF